MKKHVLILLLSSSLCFSCSKSKVEVVADELKFELLADQELNSGSTDKLTSENIIAEMDVKSYDARTGEIVFKHSVPNHIGEWKDNGYKVKVYNAGKHLFTLTFSTSIFSFLYDEPVLYYALMDRNAGSNGTTRMHKWYILSGYPYGNVLDRRKITNPEQLKNFDTIQANWNQFTAALKKAGKYKN